MKDAQRLPRTIKLYPNLRLYDGELGRYCSLDELRTWKKRRMSFLVVDSKTGEDVTDCILS